MQRRDFLAAPLAALAPISELPKVTSKRAPRRRVRGILMLVRRPKHFEPQSWRDVPDGAFEVEYCYPPRSLSECRAVAKRANNAWLKSRYPLWTIVACTDGRLSPSKKGVVA